MFWHIIADEERRVSRRIFVVQINDGQCLSNQKIQSTSPCSLTDSSVLFLFEETLSPVCARAEFSGCSSTTNAHSETGQMAVCHQNFTLGALSSRSALSMLVGALFKIFGLFLNTPRTQHSNILHPLDVSGDTHNCNLQHAGK